MTVMNKKLNSKQRRERKLLYLRNFFRLIDQPIVRAIIYKLENEPMSAKELWSTILTEQKLTEAVLRRTYVDFKILHMYELGLLIKKKYGQSVILKLSPAYYSIINSLDSIPINTDILETFVDRSDAVIRKGKLKALMLSLEQSEEDLQNTNKSTTQQLLAASEDLFEEQEPLYKASKAAREKILNQSTIINSNDKSIPSNNKPTLGRFGIKNS